MFQRHRDLDICSYLFFTLEKEIDIAAGDELGTQARIQDSDVPVLLEIRKSTFAHPLLQSFGAGAVHAGTGILDLEDYIVSNFLLPLGSLVFVLFCTRKIGWGWDNFKKEANEGEGMKIREWMRAYFTWVLPVLVIIVFIKGLI